MPHSIFLYVGVAVNEKTRNLQLDLAWLAERLSVDKA